jgi:hypothetical protein
MARLVQTTNAKERIYAQSVSFFGTNEVVLTALSATFTGMHGLHESTQTLESMKKGVDQSLEVLAEIGGKVQEAALKAGYGPTISAAAVKKLVDSVVTTRSVPSASSPKCASWRRRTRPRSAMRSRTARSASRSWSNRARLRR